ncbi:hypothetical protein HN51_063287, partial [Arachis hypogaea]
TQRRFEAVLQPLCKLWNMGACDLKPRGRTGSLHELPTLKDAVSPPCRLMWRSGRVIDRNLLHAFMFSGLNCEPITPMDFKQMFGAKAEDSDENSSNGYCARYYASDEEGDEDEGGEFW